jgi:Uma2 family endonuclease
VLIVEVLSPPTEEVDRGKKWFHYQQIPALGEYVMVSQHAARIEHYRRLESGAWEYKVVTAGSLTLACGPVLELARLYDDLPE